MSQRVVMIAVLLVGMFTLSATTADAGTIAGYGFKTKGVECLEIAKSLTGREVDGGALARCEVTGVSQAIIWCTNQPDSGFVQGQAAFNIFSFGGGLQTSDDAQCDRKKGKCSFSITLNATILGQPHEACPNDNWTVVDVVPTAFHGTLQLFKCVNSSNKVVPCDGDGDGLIDDGVTPLLQDSVTADCTLPEPTTLQFGESRFYDCP